MIKYILLVLIIIPINNSYSNESLLTLKQQLERLQREVNDLSKLSFSSLKEDSLEQIKKPIENSQLTAFDLRIYDLEKDIKKLNNNYEELVFQIDDLKNLYKELNLSISNILINYESVDSNNNKDDLSNQDISSKSLKENTLGELVIKTEDLSGKQNEITLTDEDSENPQEKLSPEQQFQKAFDLLRNQQFGTSKTAFIDFIKNNQEDVLAGTAHYWLGEIYLLQKEYREAALIFAEGYQKFPGSAKAPDILYKLSDSLVLIEKKDDACSTLTKLTEEFPKNKLVTKAENKKILLNCKK